MASISDFVGLVDIGAQLNNWGISADPSCPVPLIFRLTGV